MIFAMHGEGEPRMARMGADCGSAAADGPATGLEITTGTTGTMGGAAWPRRDDGGLDG